MISLWSITDKGAVRQQNEDSCRCWVRSDGLAAAVICDGMGGARAGKVASTIALEAFCEVLEREAANWSTSPDHVLSTAADVANQVVFFKAGMESACAGMGTTLVAALVVGDKAHILNVGDSRAYHVTSEGIARVTRDHSVVEDLVSHGEITPEQARLHPQRNLITRALGAEKTVKADLYELPVKEGDFLLLCSDGLTNMATDQEILYELLHGGPAEDCCQRLLDITLTRGAPDNVTVVLIQM